MRKGIQTAHERAEHTVDSAQSRARAQHRASGTKALGCEPDAVRLAALFLSERAPLFRVAVRITGNSSDAEDVVQVAFLRAQERARDVAGPQMRAWLHTVVRRLAFDRLREQGRLRHVDLDVNLLDAPAGEQPPYWTQLTVDDIVQALSACPAALRSTFHLWRVGWSYAEIAAGLRAPASTVATRIFRAKAHIRRYFARAVIERADSQTQHENSSGRKPSFRRL
jgi:RNA polymerase sigma-70 factor, ECF subfamily